MLFYQGFPKSATRSPLVCGMFCIRQVEGCLQPLSTAPIPLYSTAPSPAIPTQEITYESENERQDWQKKKQTKKQNKKNHPKSGGMICFLTFPGLCGHNTLSPLKDAHKKINESKAGCDGWKNNSPPHPQTAAPLNSQKIKAEHTENLHCKGQLTQEHQAPELGPCTVSVHCTEAPE